MKRLCRLFLFCCVAMSLSRAQSSPVSSSAPPIATPAASSTAAPTEPAQTPILEYSPPPAQYARAKAYSRAHYTHFFINTLYGLLILLFILRWRIAPKFRDLAERASSRRFVQLIIFAPLTLLTINFLTIPSDVWDEALQRAYGLSVQTWPAWFTDWMTNLIIMLIVGTVLVSILYAVIRRSPRRWWFYFWLASIPVLLIIFFIQPIVIDPLFFKFTPLADTQPALVAGIEKVTHRGGIDIPRDRMFLMNASSKTTETNAYVTGFGSSKRVVIWDTTIAKATIPEVLFVFGHEMGHYVLLHIPKEMSIIATIILVMLYLGYRLANWMLARWGYQWGIRDIKDWASLPALIFVISLLAFL
ncbi:MAG: M48 family metallopeptidase, partial [Terriglobales bacterium]